MVKVCWSCKEPIRLKLDTVYEERQSQWYHIRCFKDTFPEIQNPICDGCGKIIKRVKAQYKNGKWYHKECLLKPAQKQNKPKRISEVHNPTCYGCGYAIKRTKAKFWNGKWYHKRCLRAPGQKINKLKEIRRSDVLSVMRNSNGYSRPAPAKTIRVVSGGLGRPK